MQHYRAYFLDQDGHISNAIDMECADDDQAKECAKKFVSDRNAELWQEDRLIAIYEDCVEGLSILIFSERFMGCAGGCEVAEGCAVLSLHSPVGQQGLGEALDCAASNHGSERTLSS